MALRFHSALRTTPPVGHVLYISVIGSTVYNNNIMLYAHRCCTTGLYAEEYLNSLGERRVHFLRSHRESKRTRISYTTIASIIVSNIIPNNNIISRLSIGRDRLGTHTRALLALNRFSRFLVALYLSGFISSTLFGRVTPQPHTYIHTESITIIM